MEAEGLISKGANESIMNYIYRKLISLNLILLLLLSVSYLPIYAESNLDDFNIEAAAGDTDVLIVDGIQYDPDQDAQGNGWSYSVNKYVEDGPANIYLNDYTGSGIVFKKDIKSLQIYASGNNKITGTDTPCIQYDDGNLYIELETGSKLDMYAGEEHHAVSAETVSLFNRGAELYDSESKACLSIYGSERIAAVKADSVIIKSEFKGSIRIIGDTDGSAIEVSKNVELKSGHLELKGGNKPAVICTSDSNDYLIIYNGLYKYYVGDSEYNTVRMESRSPGDGTNKGSGGNSGGSGGNSGGSGGFSYIVGTSTIGDYKNEIYLKTEPEICNITLDANGGIIEGKASITMEVELADRTILNSYKPNREGYLFEGWYTNKNAPYYVYNKADLLDGYRQKQIIIYAGWFSADNGDVIVTDTFPMEISASPQGEVYMTISDFDKTILPSCLYNYFGSSGSDLVRYKMNVDIWIDQKYNWKNKGYQTLTDKNGEKYVLYLNGIYTSGHEVERDNSRIKIMEPFSAVNYNSIYYYLGDGEINGGGNVIAEESFTSGDLYLYARDDTGIKSPINKTLVGWSLKKDTSTIDYSPGDVITLEDGAVKKLYAIWEKADWKDRYIKFNDIGQSSGTYYAAYYDNNGKMLKNLSVVTDINGSVNIILDENDYEKTYQVKLFALDEKYSPVGNVKSAIRNLQGRFEITV